MSVRRGSGYRDFIQCLTVVTSLSQCQVRERFLLLQQEVKVEQARAQNRHLGCGDMGDTVDLVRWFGGRTLAAKLDDRV